MCTVLLPPGVKPIAVNKYIISYHILYPKDMESWEDNFTLCIFKTLIFRMDISYLEWYSRRSPAATGTVRIRALSFAIWSFNGHNKHIVLIDTEGQSQTCLSETCWITGHFIFIFTLHYKRQSNITFKTKWQVQVQFGSNRWHRGWKEEDKAVSCNRAHDTQTV
jgi:hypothetical protein